MGLTPWLSPCRVAAGFECSSYGTEHRCSWLDPISCSLRLRYAAQFWTLDSLWLAYESSSTVWRSRRAIEDKVCAGVLVCWCSTHAERTSVVRTGSGDPWPDSVGVKVGLAPIPSLNFKVRRPALSGGSVEVLFPYCCGNASLESMPLIERLVQHNNPRHKPGDQCSAQSKLARPRSAEAHSSSSRPPTGIRCTCLRPSLISN
jgi:hypothetical protein